MRSIFFKFVRTGLVLSLPLAFASIAITACTFAGGSSDDEGIVAIKDIDISGVSQKGPFIRGSSVTVQELNGTTLKQTGKSFKGTIKSDKGDFVINNVSLASQYAIVEVTGYYRREISEERYASPGISSGMITLRALTDLSDRNTVNVNLLTHLEYDRVMYLMDTGLSFREAKNQAEAEIFKAFEIQGDFASAEDLDIFREGEGNAALLAISILMLNEFSEAEFTEFAANFAADIETDGTWDNDSSKARLAGWAKNHDRSLSGIRKDIEKWDLGPVPNFEKYVRNFWYMIFGFEECGAEQEGLMSAIKNDSLCEIFFTKQEEEYYSRTIWVCDPSERFVCRNGVWDEASEFESDFFGTGKIKGGEDGEIFVGVKTGSYYVYDDSLKKWVLKFAIEDDEDLIYVPRFAYADLLTMGVGCTLKRNGEMRISQEGKYRICKDSYWETATELEIDTYGEPCSTETEGVVVLGAATSSNKYYCSRGKWISMTNGWNWAVPQELRLNPDIVYDSITDERDGRVYKTVKIGNQTWMAEDLSYTDATETRILNNNFLCVDSMRYIWDYESNINYPGGKYFIADSFSTDVRGCAYTWMAAINSIKLEKDADNPLVGKLKTTCALASRRVQGICPDGWHLPNNDEWSELITAVGGVETAGKALKSQTGWNKKSNGSDDFGFSALPVGWSNERAYGGGSADAASKGGEQAFFWSVSENVEDCTKTYYIALNTGNSILLYGDDKSNRNLSKAIRCVKD